MGDEAVSLSASLEDYLEAIQEIRGDGGVVRVRDIAKRMKVRAPSATAAVRRLKRMGLVSHARYEYVELTGRGEEAAQRVTRRHQMLKRFLEEVLGVSEKVAERDACQLEHAMSMETMARLVQFMEQRETPGSGARTRETTGWTDGDGKTTGGAD